MSVVTTLMLHVDRLEDGVTLDRLNAWFAERRPTRLLDNTDADAAWGGGKAPQVRVDAGAFNFFPTDEFMAYLGTLPWEYPESVQLFVNEERDARFAVHLLAADRTWRQLCDGAPPDPPALFASVAGRDRVYRCSSSPRSRSLSARRSSHGRRDRLQLVGTEVAADAEAAVRAGSDVRADTSLVQCEHAVVAVVAAINRCDLDAGAVLGRVVVPPAVAGAVGVQAHARPGAGRDGAHGLNYP